MVLSQNPPHLDLCTIRTIRLNEHEGLCDHDRGYDGVSVSQQENSHLNS